MPMEDGSKADRRLSVDRRGTRERGRLHGAPRRIAVLARRSGYLQHFGDLSSGPAVIEGRTADPATCGLNFLSAETRYSPRGAPDNLTDNVSAYVAFFLALDDSEMVATLTPGEGVRGYSATMRCAADLLACRAASSSGHVPAVRVARLYAHSHDAERALHWLERVCDARESPLVHLDVGWDWEALRSTERFRAIRRQVGLPAVLTSHSTTAR
jgi:hypothetical protein